MNDKCRWLAITIVLLVALLVPANTSAAGLRQAQDERVQTFLDQQPGVLKSYSEGELSAAQIIEAASVYYDMSPRIVLSLLEASNKLISDPLPTPSALHYPISPVAASGFTTQIDWAGRELRAGLGPYDHAPMVSFTDGTSITLTLAQAPEGLAVQRLLAKGRSQTEWRQAVQRFNDAFLLYFQNELPQKNTPISAIKDGFLQRPWAEGTRVVHLAYFDHAYPTVDTNAADNGSVLNYLGRGNVQYDGHDGHDYYFPDRPIGTYIYAAADGIAHASTHRGNGVWIEHANGYVTVYWHLDRFARIFKGLVNTGAGVPVRAGDLLGSSGRSGFVQGNPHLHFEVRHNGRQVDPYGWFGSGADPCTDYAACAPSRWLWDASLVGEFDFTPPVAEGMELELEAPFGTFTINPQPYLSFLAHMDSHPLQQRGQGNPTLAGTLDYVPAQNGDAVRVSASSRLAYPTVGNLNLSSGTLALWVSLPEEYPTVRRQRHYIFSASANPDANPIYTGTLALRRELDGQNQPYWNFWTSPESGVEGRNDLRIPDTLAAGMHHFVLTWDRELRMKALFIDGQLLATAVGVELAQDVGPLLELGRFGPAGPVSNIAIDDLAIFERTLETQEVARLFMAASPPLAGNLESNGSLVELDINALNPGNITSMRIGINGLLGDPEPFSDTLSLEMPSQTGSYTISVELNNRSGRRSVLTDTLTRK